MSALPVLVFGAPGAILGLVLCAVGLLYRHPGLLVAGGVVLLPSSLYLGGHPGLSALLLLPLLPWTAAWALRRGAHLLAGLLVVPNAVVVAWLAVVTVWNLMAG